MPPITKFWLSTLKNEQSVNSPVFLQFISEILDFCASHSGPGSGMHAFYQDINNPSRLFMITGYPSQELNTAADKIYAEEYLPRMFDYVQHVWLKQLDMDITTVRLDEKVVVAYGKNPSQWKDEKKGFGGWDVWPKTAQAEKNTQVEGGNQNFEIAADQVWVQISRLEDGSADPAEPTEGEKLYLHKVMSR
ncbi:hypothetical protein N7509_012163 [Penicillium cosmopolitanum]|uniref:Uncharacterized protein n=1 Tax=Penicillium cosmopolitanum TaxID=1131564 RepID=A0A9W9VFM7_9EURO|nr:uncharacterized protein N7509_012163 [Penicillium cosmopolitanum]KAJ5379044.1 hypothetical protein N7509_012163 [Penicillium cosmopolitanum]